MKSIFCLIVATAAICSLYSQPRINSFTPATATPGTTITISGTGFDATPANNIFYFGAVKATITAATVTTLQVTVPFGATYAYLTATVGGLTGYSSKKFLPLAPYSAPLTTASFDVRGEYVAGNYVFSHAVADFDGDGKTDMVAANYSDATISIFRNVSNPGAFSIQSKITLATSTKPGDIKAADLNGDGKPDIVTANDASKTVSVFINSSPAIGTISFLPKQDFGTGTYAVGVAIGDIDGDGKTDLVELNNQEDSLSVLRNTSTGGVLSFAPRVSFATAYSPNKTELIDIDEDGKLDIVVANLFGASVAVYKNGSTPGAIAMSSVTTLPVSGQAYQVDFGDLNADGKMDIVAGCSGTAISILTNTSTGTTLNFSRQDITVGNTPKSVAVSDLNGDGKPDIAVTGSELKIAVLQNTSATLGTVSFAPKVEIAMQSSLDQVLIADLDNDGKGDLLVGRQTNIVLIRNRLREPVVSSFTPTSGTRDSVITIKGQNFSGTTAVRFGATAATAFGVVNDSTISAIVGRGSTGFVYVTNSYGTAASPGLFNYFLPKPVITSFSPDTGRAGTIVTIRGRNFDAVSTSYVRFGGVRARITDFASFSDTLMRVIVPVAGTYAPIAITSYNGGTGYSVKPFGITFPGGSAPLSFNSFEAKIDSATGAGPAAVVLADIDGDEKLDIAVANYDANTFSVFRNKSDTVRIALNSKSNFATGNGPRSITTADIDSDGRLDMIVANSLSNTFTVFRNQTVIGINFGTRADYTTSATPFVVKAGDLDGDGKPDVAVLCRNGIIGLFNNISSPGQSALLYRTNITTDAAPTGMAMADINQDGKMDLIVTDSLSGSVSVYRNTVNGTLYSFAKTTIPGGNHSGITVGDINGDGKPDLIATNWNTTNLTLYTNQSTGSTISFSRQQYPVVVATAGVAVADVTGDGKPDLAVSALNAAAIAVLKNTATGIDTAKWYATTTRPFDFEMGDLDGDSKPEIVACNYAAGTISILRNNIGEIAKTFACPDGNVILTSNLQGATYQWQVDTSSGYMNLINDAFAAGVNTPTLQLTGVPSGFYGYRYRCVVNGNQYSDAYSLKFQNRWQGTVNNNWENGANWSCGVVPDANTDVVISSGSVVLSSNTSCRSVSVINSGSLTIVPGNILTVIQ